MEGVSGDDEECGCGIAGTGVVKELGLEARFDRVQGVEGEVYC